MEVREEKKPKNIFTKTIAYYQKNGLKKCLKKIYSKFFHTEQVSYNKWRKGALPGEKELAEQRKTRFELEPVFSIVVPLYYTPLNYFRIMVASVQAQTYGKWELCLADGSGRENETEEQKALAAALRAEAEKLVQADSRIRYRNLGGNLGIAGNTNEALSMATGQWIALLDHDDTLAPDALYECVSAVNRQRSVQVLYSDEDKVDETDRNYRDPHFKPDFNIDLLRTINYICHLFVVRRDVMEAAGPFSSHYDGAQDHDFIFRCIEKAEHIVHIPKVLYHWRCHSGSTSENPASKLYAFESGVRAVKAHLDRLGIPASVEHGVHYGMYRVRYERAYDPLVSIIIPNKDHKEDLELCIRSLEEKSSYRNYEILIVENNSTSEEIFRYYEELEQKPHIRVLHWKEGFNYSAINNFAAKEARGEYLLLLNNDIEFINENCLEELLSFCMRPEVGIVGAKLYYGDDTIQHAGVIVGLRGIAGHAFLGLPRAEFGYVSKAVCTQDLSAVTAACLMVKKSVYEEVGGLEEGYAVAFNDVDFCLKVRKAGYLVVYNANAEAYHYESKSRGAEDTPEKVARFQQEIRLFQKRWGDFLKAGDPYYNVNLTLEKHDFTYRDPNWTPQEFE